MVVHIPLVIFVVCDALPCLLAWGDACSFFERGDGFALLLQHPTTASTQRGKAYVLSVRGTLFVYIRVNMHVTALFTPDLDDQCVGKYMLLVAGIITAISPSDGAAAHRDHCHG